MRPHSANTTTPHGPRRHLSLWDSISLIIGIIVGVGIYETAPLIARGAGGGWETLTIWTLGGLLSLAGALCWAELAAMYPEDGGEYIYLRESYGSTSAFLFAWSKVCIVRPGSIAAMAFPFAHYFRDLTAPSFAQVSDVGIAAAAVVLLTALNLFGLRSGTYTQNLLTAAKLIGIVFILIVGVLAAVPEHAEITVRPETTNGAASVTFGLALILVLFTYGGWNEISYVAAEVRQPEKNLLRSLCAGTAIVTALYLLLNAVFLYVLGYEGTRSTQTVAAATVESVLPEYSGRMVSAIICISALGAIQGLIFTGARVSYALGKDHLEFSLLARWNKRFNTPDLALLLQALLSVLILLLTGSFALTVVYTTAVVWFFFLLTGISIFVLRHKHPARPRPYRVHCYPFTPIVFCLSCVYLIWSALLYDLGGTAIAVAVLLAGLPLKYCVAHFSRQ